MITWEEFRRRTEKEYFDYFFGLNKGTYKDNWLETEEWFQEKYNIPKYPDYSSFRNAKSKYLRGVFARG